MNMQTECAFGSESCGVSCTGFEGGPEWEDMHKVCNKIGCSICSGHCHEHIQAWRDRIAYEKGKKVHDMKNLKRECEGWKCTGDKL